VTATVSGPEGFVFHQLNAFEEPAIPVTRRQTLVVDSIYVQRFSRTGSPGVDSRRSISDSLPGRPSESALRIDSGQLARSARAAGAALL